MKRFWSIVMALAAAAMALLAASTVAADDAAFTSGAGIGSVGGAEIYTHICQGCHMPQAQGAIGAGHYPALAGDKALVSAQYMALTVLNGKNGMPPFGLPADQVMETRTVHLSDRQIAEVVNYVRSNFGNHFKDKIGERAVAALPHPGKPVIAPGAGATQ
jgi:mono/diheme cytochrome c family protein